MCAYLSVQLDKRHVEKEFNLWLEVRCSKRRLLLISLRRPLKNGLFYYTSLTLL